MGSMSGERKSIGMGPGATCRSMASWSLVLVLASAILVTWGCGGRSAKHVVDPGYDASGDTGPLAQCYHIGEKWPQSYPPMTQDKAYQLALKWSQCGAIDGTNLGWFWQCAMGTCLSYSMPGVEPPSMDCILAAQNCDEVRCCWGVNSDTNCDDTLKDHCNGSVLVQCWPVADGRKMVRRWDCAWSSDNPKCLADAEGNPRCAFGTCEDADEWTKCEGDVAVGCGKGTETHIDCTRRGRKCATVATEDGKAAACVLKEGCLVPYCDGNTFVMCEGGAEVARYNCDWYGEGFTCTNPTKDEEGDWTGGCTPPADKVCDPENDEDYCEGSVARYCLDNGAWVEFDCADFANGTCRKFCPLDFGEEECEPGDETCEPEPPCEPTDPTQGNSVGCAEGK